MKAVNMDVLIGNQLANGSRALAHGAPPGVEGGPAVETSTVSGQVSLRVPCVTGRLSREAPRRNREGAASARSGSPGAGSCPEGRKRRDFFGSGREAALRYAARRARHIEVDRSVYCWLLMSVYG